MKIPNIPSWSPHVVVAAFIVTGAVLLFLTGCTLGTWSAM